MSRYGHSYRRGPNYSLVTAIVLILLVVVGGVGACAASYYSDEDVTISIRDKNIVPTGSGSSSGHDYRINADVEGKGNETFVIEDSIVKGQFNTGDIYFRLHEGRKYECKAYGFRHPFLSSFRAIHECDEVGPADPEVGR